MCCVEPVDRIVSALDACAAIFNPVSCQYSVVGLCLMLFGGGWVPVGSAVFNTVGGSAKSRGGFDSHPTPASIISAQDATIPGSAEFLRKKLTFRNL